MTEIPSCILSQYQWYNANIQLDKTSIQFSRFSKKILINETSQIFNNNGSIKKWHEFKRENTIYYNTITIQFIIKNNEIAANLITHDHHFIKGSTLDKSCNFR